MEQHITRLRTIPMLRDSEVVVMCERNLGFESEHLQRALSGIPNVRHRIDHAAKRYGIIMNEEVKYGACTENAVKSLHLTRRLSLSLALSDILYFHTHSL